MTDDRSTDARLTELVRELAHHLPGFRASFGDEMYPHRLIAPDGMIVSVRPAKEGDRAVVRCVWPMDAGAVADPHSLDIVSLRTRLPRITVSLGWNAAAIAQEIQERFLPEYERLHQQVIDKLRVKEAARERHRQAAERVATALGASLPSDHTPDQPYRLEIAGTSAHGDIGGVIDVLNDTHMRIHLDAVPVKPALAMLRPLLGLGAIRPRLR